ncbi:4-alpha-glucanotransferase [Alteromonas lipolytica]|uniref:4-alpha-glucanotransferase n=1 Tax=Alteromonas lipolytica TaxID=1856405 RepID=A0A1E8FGY5_9ALTE|nr:4-alpha-glucanotransferase [Alteromonas lipolytica]OFI35006.1 4-alpha-glucanotransferase [Alteromonas lipolytica]
MTNQVLQKLVEMRGVETQYVDAWGNPATISETTKAKLLQALGYDISNDSVIAEQLDEEIANIWSQPFDPVSVQRTVDTKQIRLRLPLSRVTDTFCISLELETGQNHIINVIPVEQELLNVGVVDDIEFHEYCIELPQDLSCGYHQIKLLEDDKPLAVMRYIVAPEACYQPPTIAQGNKLWGLSVQLYCLRSENNWGIGDFSDLAQLVTSAAQQGAGFIGLNPIHALYPSNPEACSPYGPSSRRWLNFLYIDVSALPCFDNDAVQSVVMAADFQQQLAQARATEYVDYTLVTELKLTALNALFDVYHAAYLTKNSKQNRAFKAFIKEGGESLEMLATYDAMQEYLKAEGKDAWGWPVFPDNWQGYYNEDVATFAKQHKKRVQFYMFLQWQAATQLEQANQAALDAGMPVGIYRDLAVGVSEGSAEIWGNKDLYCTAASVGAPPDVLGPLGQNWGLPPMDPEMLYLQGYQPIIDLFATNMKSSGALRIDHAMGLLRLWWVCQGDNAKEGGYVYYPLEDLLGILALESHRHQAMVIGEDLGTVPEEIREVLASNGVYSYRVFFFEKAEDGGFYSPAHYPVQSMSTLTTHDMPTLIGYWHCLDLELGKALGLYTDEAVLQSLYASRHADKQAILDSLHGHGRVGDEIGRNVDITGMSRELNHALQVHMAYGSSALLSLQLEDWLQMDKPVNIPGTFMEYPNWRRKLSQNLEDIFTNPDIQSLAASLTAGRRQASQQENL